MQTFLPFPGFADCAASLEPRRLGKQRVEVLQIVRAGVATVRSQAELARLGLLPPWLGDEALHRSHRAALLRKDPDWYGPRFPDAPDDTDYLWPPRAPTSSAE
jgi:hypothetical protein